MNKEIFWKRFTKCLKKFSKRFTISLLKELGGK